MTWGDAPDVVATIRSIMLDSRESVRALHDAARPAPPDRRRSLRADAREHRSAPRRLVGDLLSPRGRGRHRLRSDARAAAAPSDQYRVAAARVVERSRDHAGRAAPVVPSPAVGLPHEVRTHALGRAGAAPTGAAPKKPRDSRRDGRRCAARSTRSATRPCSPSCAGSRTTPPRGATSASAISRRPARGGRRRATHESSVAVRERATASEPRDRSAPAKWRARARVGESEGRSPSDGLGVL